MTSSFASGIFRSVSYATPCVEKIDFLEDRCHNRSEQWPSRSLKMSTNFAEKVTSDQDQNEVLLRQGPSIANVIVNPLEQQNSTDHVEETEVDRGSQGTESPGTSQMSPPPSYHDIPGTVPAHQGVSRGPPPSYEDAVDPNGKIKRVLLR